MITTPPGTKRGGVVPDPASASARALPAKSANVKLSRALSTADRAGRAVGWDRSALLATVLALVAALIAQVWSFTNGLVLDYNDAFSHMNIARRVIDNRTPGLAQLGTVWLPVPHLLMQPFIVVDYFWRTGLAGALVGLPCFVIAAVMLFQTTRLVVHREYAAWLALLVFITNPNALYLQTTALTEPVLLMSMTASTYYLVRWCTYDTTADLIMASGFAALAVGSRYDGWFFAIACGAIVGATTLLRWREVDRAEGSVLAYIALPFYAMFMWLFYNWLVFGDALAFEHSQYSAAFQQAQFAADGLLPTKSNLLVSAHTYSSTVLLDLGSVVSVFALAGVIAYLAVNRLRPASFAAYSYLSAFVFNVTALYAGQTVIFTPISNPSGYFNTRYGVVMLPGAAFFTAYLVDLLARRYRRVIAASVLCGIVAVQGTLWAPRWPLRVVTVADGLNGAMATHTAYPAARWLKQRYKGGGILFDDAHSEFILSSGIDMREYYLSGPLQTLALTDPDHFAQWIVLAPVHATDKVNIALQGSSVLRQFYVLQFAAGGYSIYERRGPARGLTG